MIDETKTPKTIEELETEIISLKIRLKRVESFIQNMPSGDDYLETSMLNDGTLVDDLLEEAEKVVRQYDKASSSLLQRRLSIGYARAARLMDMLESKGVVSPSDGTSAPRNVLAK